MIDINDITLRIGTRVLLEHASAHIASGRKCGLVGTNGCGKSTLFRVLQGETETETGEVKFPARCKIAYVEQETKETEKPILEYVLAHDRELATLTQRLETAEGEELAEIHERLNALEAASAPARAAEILNGLGFKNEDLVRPLKEFSGGWRMRLALAGALFQDSDVLLLDEPTNHLDLEASIWLESHLRQYRGTLLLISHDKTVLNSVCDSIIHFDHLKLETYNGNYDTFCRTREAKKELLGKLAAKQEKQRAHLQSFVDRFRYKASKAKQAQSRIKMLERMETITLMEDDAATTFDFPQPAYLAPPLLSLEDVTVGYDGKAVLSRLNLSVVDNDRIALLGANGNGKSTLAKLFSGRLEVMEGRLLRSPKLGVGYFAQHQTEELPLSETPLAYLSHLMNERQESRVRAHLARFGLGQEKALTRIENLSGGEKARLLFATMTISAPALLILDEPTNHLDISARDALVTALNEYKGSVILITHDLNLIELVADNLWLVKDGRVKNYDGDLEDYKRLLLGDDKPVVKKEKSVSAKREIKAVAAAKKAELLSLKADLRTAERRLEKLQQRREELEKSFLVDLSAEEIVEKQKELSYVQNDLDLAENDWLTLSEQIENLSGK